LVPLLASGALAAEHRVSNDSATVRHAFDGAEEWSRVFDDSARAEWQQPEAVIEALAIRPGATVADIGAGTGYFNRFFAAAVGDSGAVKAVDIEPGMVAYMNERARDEHTAQVEAILGEPDDPNLPSGLDLVFLCNTYHHIDGRRDYFRRLRGRLAPGGRLAIVDYKAGDLPVGPPAGHKISPEGVTEELSAAGYVLVESLDFLPYQYFLIFEPVTAP
jgi:predicted methyltransferase